MLKLHSSEWVKGYEDAASGKPGERGMSRSYLAGWMAGYREIEQYEACPTLEDRIPQRPSHPTASSLLPQGLQPVNSSSCLLPNRK